MTSEMTTLNEVKSGIPGLVPGFVKIIKEFEDDRIWKDLTKITNPQWSSLFKSG